MDFGIELGKVAVWLLVATRLGAMLLFAPLLGFATMPALVRLTVVLALSLALYPGVPEMLMPTEPVLLALLFLGEIVVGGAMGFGLLAIGGALSFGGRVLDYQIGFNAGSLLNPLTRSFEPLTGSILLALAGVLFFVLDWHHTLLRGASYSFTVLPPGHSGELQPEALIKQFGLVFAFGLSVVAPVFIILLATDIGIAVAARSLPQFNVYFVSLPLKIGMGLTLLALCSRPIQHAIVALFEAAFVEWPMLLGGIK